MITMSPTQAQSRFVEILKAAQQEPITIADRGKPLAYIISPEELHKLLADQEARDQAVRAYQDYQDRVRQTATPAANALTDEDVNRLVHELR